MAEINGFYNTRANYQGVILTENVGSSFRLGSGINMSDPLFPLGAPTYAFAVRPPDPDSKMADTIPNENVITDASSSYFQTETDEEEAKTISAYFSASYSDIADGSAAYSYAHERRKTYQAIYAIIENTSTAIPFESDLKWKAAPSSESHAIPDDQVLAQFVGQYGSHYIAAIRYGFRIAIRGEVNRTDEKTVENFSVAFKASFGVGGGKGGLDTTSTEILKTASTDLRAVVRAGSMTPPQSFVLYGYGQIVDFLAALKDGHISVTRAPLSANLNSYLPSLVAYPRSRKALAPQKGQVTNAPFGVPVGTVIAWYPGSAQQWTDEKGIHQLAVPGGWAICDGRPGTPDLRDKFIMGSSEVKDIGITGGTPTHSHVGVVSGLGSLYEGHNIGSDGELTNRGTTALTVDIKQNGHLPPFCTLIYLVKL